ncbi:hypothetical protein ACFLVH_00710 [Chloroflexota bacterium]
MRIGLLYDLKEAESLEQDGPDDALEEYDSREIVRAILERKYKGVCSPEYIEIVVESFQDDPVRLRNPKYVKRPSVPIKRRTPVDKRIMLVINDRHLIHHVEEVGYVESPVRIDHHFKGA